MACKSSIERIDALLPQTQCGLCGYGGCLPYATALIEENAAINLCPPGGVETLHALASALNQDATPYEYDFPTKAKTTVHIREAECIGCTKCINVCPVDAIVGAAKLMHTVLEDACTGCDLCIPACPVDCIDILPDLRIRSEDEKIAESKQWRLRFQQREMRLVQQQKSEGTLVAEASTEQKKEYINEALERIRAKRQGK